MAKLNNATKKPRNRKEKQRPQTFFLRTRNEKNLKIKTFKNCYIEKDYRLHKGRALAPKKKNALTLALSGKGAALFHRSFQ